MDHSKFEVEISLDDYLHFCSAQSRKLRIILRILVLVAVFCSIWKAISDGLGWEAILVAAFPMLFLLGVLVIPINKWFWAKAYRDDPLIAEKFTFEFDSEGFQTRAKSGSVNIRWKDIFKTRVTQQCLILYINKRRGIILPKRYLDEQTLAKITQIVLTFKGRQP